MKRKVHLTKRFRRDYRKFLRSRSHRIGKIDELMRQLIRKQELDPKHDDHALHGEWRGCRDCHIEGDWVLIYELGTDENGHEIITFHATDNHENLFG